MKLNRKRISIPIALVVVLGTLASARAWLPNVGFWSPSGCTHGKQTFITSGSPQTFTVSAANCTNLTIKAWGGGGVGAGYFDVCDANYYFNGGGGGGYATLNYAATVGHNLTIYVGMAIAGYDGSQVYPDGGAGAGSSAHWYGTGGGSSSVWDSATELVEAGGGGGGGSTSGTAGGGTNSSCGTPGINAGVNAVYNSSAAGGGGYCGGSAGQGGSSYFQAGGSQSAGSGISPGNPGDPDFPGFHAEGAGGINGGVVVIKY